MAISRMQQPRQMYGLGSLVKKAVKGVKSFVKSDLGKAALLAGGAYFAPTLFGRPAGFGSFGNLVKGGISSLGLDVASGAKPTLGQFGKVFAIGSLGGAALQALTASGADEEELGNIRDVESLKSYLRQGYKQLNPQAEPEQVEAFVETNTTEYRADGGRIGFAEGMPEEGIETLLPKQKPSQMMQEVDSVTQSVDNFAQLIAQSGDPSSFRGHVDLLSEFIQKNDIDPSAAFDYVKRRVDEIKPGLSKFIFTTTEDMPVENKAYGGRIGYSGGTKGPDDLYTRSYKRVMELMDEGYDFGSAVKKYMEEEKERENKSYGGRIGYDGGTDFQKWLEGKQKFDQGQNAEQLYREYLEDKRRQKVAEQKTMAANGGRIGYAFGNNPEQNAINAAGIMDLPLNQNPAGATELDLRDSGGFIPPVGVKEKADDIPAMLSNNEFVFTADAVRGMGGGDVNKGAQRMYDMMKKLEGGGRV
jgi:hypothetical protein